MNIHLTGRHIDITAPLKAFTESKIQKLERFIDGITNIYVTLSVEKYRQRAEVNVHSRGNTYLTAVEEKHRPGSRQEGTFDVIARDGGEAPDEDSRPRVVESHRFVIKPLSVEDAVAEIDVSHAEFLVFRNAVNERVNVLYRRPDGNYGLIDPGGQ